ncbi:hypothetical protein PGT21_010184 [Puccinia graminis f. sp. tritici]|uniref:Uncharacterized protein n=1 Tax=Puccinia graminis f. sp. tritici TaxID=56615 RepID=A0A5B0Q5E7_PUCGR|nr:hypothetical protein PGT21_010184 [Puccinia graminis f. sp. tritici]
MIGPYGPRSFTSLESLPPPASPSLDLDKPIKIGSSNFLSSLDELLPSSDRINRQAYYSTSPDRSKSGRSLVFFWPGESPTQTAAYRPSSAQPLTTPSVFSSADNRPSADRGSPSLHRPSIPPPSLGDFLHSSAILSRKPSNYCPPPSSPQPLSPSASPSIAVLNARANNPTTGPFLGW